MGNSRDKVSSKIKFRFFPNHAKIESLVKVVEVRQSDNQAELLIICKALDSLGFIFDMEMVFVPDDAETVAAIVRDMNTGSIYVVEGHFSIQNSKVKLFDPSYAWLKDGFADKVQVVFNTNQDGLEWLAS